MVEFKAKLLGPAQDLDNSGNSQWWEQNPMVYDWDRAFGDPSLTQVYFDKIDRLFGEGHSLCNNPRWPAGFILENFIPYPDLKGKQVLEIGCGAGLVASHIAKSGARLTAIDLTEQAVVLTRRRFELGGLDAEIRQMDAEKLAFADAAFDYVISWGGTAQLPRLYLGENKSVLLI
jgi:2-polyprenyl-3-methyl-5-hydroxy-6-metoxy-1,4-benzoquinol methylase